MSVFDFPKAREVISSKPDDLRSSLKQVVAVVNGILAGRMNAVAEVTLDSSATSTTVLDARLTINSFVSFDPVTQNAATEKSNGTLYVTSANRRNGSFTLTHANNGQTDRTFKMLIIG